LKQTGQAGLKDRMKKRRLNAGTLLAIILGLLFVYIVPELIQYLFASLFGISNADLAFNLFFPEAGYDLIGSPFLITSISLLPIIVVVIMTEAASYLLKKTSVGHKRNSIISFVLISGGFLLVKVFYGAIVLVMVSGEYSADFLNLANYFNLDFTYRIMSGIFSTLILFAYINSISRRILQYLNISYRG